MILLTIRDSDNLRLGVKTARGVIDVAAAQAALGQDQGDGRLPQTVEAAIAGGEAARSALADLVARAEAADATGSPWLMDEESLTLGPAVPNPGKIVCVGLNYRKHAEETGAAIPTSPVLFSKFSNTVAGPDEDVPLTDAATQYDYEVELAVVMGETTKNVSTANALNSVFGYATANDLSARDLQNRTSQWILGKTMDKFMPIGPYLVTADQVGDPQKLAIRTWLNGELRQNSNTDDMIFPVAELIAYISRHFTLEPGDVIITGTPEGVILGMAEKRWMVPGDVVEVEVDGLGKLRNRMVAG
ncbi:MAG: 2-hydroxyhepta-2,4-diene,7-dioate isomerase [Thermomicrobiales bacterium]|jgi:2-keto-4-pentenoate hydratase/2-oxohepta-3-ene-1,7-dioic acid hydratase in catechol pathway|nr:2-hydroxyhepta-2,4-diene,7-dioate isomerase [Thermomicrobiales bacterium]MDF3017718.1 2-hydroxyhepta-2,4-diene,7-dioate isomerase [Thermomicrobiales bacterium]